jgi:hypothetical protein
MYLRILPHLLDGRHVNNWYALVESAGTQTRLRPPERRL